MRSLSLLCRQQTSGIRCSKDFTGSHCFGISYSGERDTLPLLTPVPLRTSAHTRQFSPILHRGRSGGSSRSESFFCRNQLYHKHSTKSTSPLLPLLSFPQVDSDSSLHPSSSSSSGFSFSSTSSSPPAIDLPLHLFPFSIDPFSPPSISNSLIPLLFFTRTEMPLDPSCGRLRLGLRRGISSSSSSCLSFSSSSSPSSSSSSSPSSSSSSSLCSSSSSFSSSPRISLLLSQGFVNSPLSVEKKKSLGGPVAEAVRPLHRLLKLTSSSSSHFHFGIVPLLLLCIPAGVAYTSVNSPPSVVVRINASPLSSTPPADIKRLFGDRITPPISHSSFSSLTSSSFSIPSYSISSSPPSSSSSSSCSSSLSTHPSLLCNFIKMSTSFTSSLLSSLLSPPSLVSTGSGLSRSAPSFFKRLQSLLLSTSNSSSPSPSSSSSSSVFISSMLWPSSNLDISRLVRTAIKPHNMSRWWWKGNGSPRHLPSSLSLLQRTPRGFHFDSASSSSSSTSMSTVDLTPETSASVSASNEFIFPPPPLPPLFSVNQYSSDSPGNQSPKTDPPPPPSLPPPPPPPSLPPSPPPSLPPPPPRSLPPPPPPPSPLPNSARRDLFARSEPPSSQNVPKIGIASYPANSRTEDRMDVRTIRYDGSDCLVATVIDGHGGWHVAEFVKNNLALRVEEQLNSDESGNHREDIVRAFLLVDEQIRTNVRQALKLGFVKPVTIGACALSVIVKPSQLIVANAGDCQAVLSRKGVAVVLNVQQNANNPTEQRRLREAHPNENVVNCFFKDAPLKNGLLKGKQRVVKYHGCYVKRLLCPTHSFGDFYLKEEEFSVPRLALVPLPHTFPYITAQPQVDVYPRHLDDEFIVVASDGIWDVFDSQQAVDIVQEKLREARAHTRTGGLAPAEFAAAGLVTAVKESVAQQFNMSVLNLERVPQGIVRRKLHDDLSVCVVLLD